MRIRFAIALLTCLVLACGGEVGPKKPMGLLPTATTTAEPEWLPFAIRAGASAAPDAREKHLVELRRLTTGWSVQGTVFSPDAREIAVVAKAPGAKEAGLWLVPLAGGDPRRLSADGERVLGVTGTTARPWRLVYWTDAADAPQVTEVTPSGERKPLAVGDVRPRAAALSADGAKLFVVGETKNDKGVFLMADGKPRLLVSDKGALPSLALSADRSYVAWPSGEAGKPRIVLASVEGRGVQTIVSGPGAVPVFLAGTRRLLFSSDADAVESEIYAIDLDAPGAKPERVTFSQADAPSAAPDGTVVAFASSRAGGTRDLYVARWVDDP